jgi:hypothetical protein
MARLLRIDWNQIPSHRASLAQRPDYFAEMARSGDLFLDPDTGIQTGHGGQAPQYVKPAEPLRTRRARCAPGRSRSGALNSRGGVM